MLNEVSIPKFIVTAVALLFSLSVHEASHATAVYWLSDDAISRERITLNPMSHIDIVGTVLVPFVMFFTSGPCIAWAKPVIYRSDLLTRKFKAKISKALISATGPLSNIVVGAIFSVIIALYVIALTSDVGLRHVFYTAAINNMPEDLMALNKISTENTTLLCLCGASVHVNITIAVLNMLPIRPLDGSDIVAGFLPDHWQDRYNTFQQNPFSHIVLMLVVLSSTLTPLLDNITNSMQNVLTGIAKLMLKM